MFRTRHVRLLRPVVGAGAWLSLLLAACQGPDEYHWDGLTAGQAGSGPTGAAGSDVSGAAGNDPSGAAGNMAGAAGSVMSGAAGTSGSGGMAGTTGVAGSGPGGRGGAMGTGGQGGRGGVMGTGGAGGTTGTGGAGGRGGAMGTGGAGGRGGTTAGTGGRGGTQGGRGGTTGTGGSGTNSCPLGGRLDCTATGALDMGPDGMIVDFSTGQWNAMTAKFCDAHGLDGGISAYAGTGSMAMAAVDTMAQNLRLTLSVSAGQWAGGRVNFDSCVDATAFNSIQFTAAVASGSLTGCAFQVQLQTQSQRPMAATNPSGGTCTAATCEQYPAATLTAPTGTAAMMYTVRFTSFMPAGSATSPTAGQLSGVQWQLNSNNGTGTCMVELRIDNVRFVTQ